MEKIKKNIETNTLINYIIKYLFCLLPAILAEAAGIIGVTFLYYKMSERPKAIFFSVFVVIAFAAFLLGNFSHKKFKGRGIVTGLISGTAFFFINFILILIFKTADINLFLLIILPICLIFSAIGGILSSNSKKRYI